MGRPRQLSLSRIIDAALELGLENLTLTAVAARLGVAAPALYTYVDSRDTLLKLVAARQLQRPQLEDKAQPWTEVIRAHAEGVVELFGDEPQLFSYFLAGGFGPGAEMEYLETFLALLVARGFSPSEALRAYRVSSQIALGAAAERAHAGNADRTGRSHAQSARAYLDDHRTQLPNLSACADIYLDERRHFAFDDALQQFLEGVAAARAEAAATARDEEA